MNLHNHTADLSRKLSALTLGTGVAAVATSAVGAIVPATIPADGRPPAGAGTLNWDVDGGGTTDFVLKNIANNSAQFGAVGGVGNAWLDDDSYIYYSAKQNFFPKNVATTRIVSSGITTQKWADDVYRFFTINGVNQGSQAPHQGWTTGVSGYFGFRFKISGNTHYGWARMTVTTSPKGRGYTLHEAYYNNTPGAPIKVGAIGADTPTEGLVLMVR